MDKLLEAKRRLMAALEEFLAAPNYTRAGILREAVDLYHRLYQVLREQEG